MTTLIVFATLIGLAPPAPAQEGAPPAEPARGYYVFEYATGPDWPRDLPLEELFRDERLQGHFQFMGALAERGILVLGGPFKDLSGAMGVIEADDLEAAREIVSADPGIAAGAFTLDTVRPWHPSVAGCVEERAW